MADIIQIRRGTASQWSVTNPVLADGELGFETDTKKGKLGNGLTAWNSLPYSFTGQSSSVAEQIVASASKTTPVDADLVGLVDSADSNLLKKLTWSNIKATLKTYFDTLYQAVGNFVTIDTTQTVTGEKTFSAKSFFSSALINTIHDVGTISSGFLPIQTDFISSVRKITLGGNFTMSIQSGTAGAVVRLYLIQDATGARTLSWLFGSGTLVWSNGGSAPTLSTAPNAIDLVTLTWVSDNVVHAEFIRGAVELISASSINTGTLGVPRGGTGFSSYTIGSYLSATGATTLSERTPAQVLSDIGASPLVHNQNASTIQAGTFASGNFVFPANLEIQGQVNSPVNAKGNSGTGTVTFNWNDANIQSVTLTGSCTFAFSNPTSGASYQIIITQDATGSRTITFPTIHWEGRTVPTLTGTANSKDIVTLTYDGTNYNGVISKNHGV